MVFVVIQYISHFLPNVVVVMLICRCSYMLVYHGNCGNMSHDSKEFEWQIKKNAKLFTGLVQTQSIYRRQNKCNLTTDSFSFLLFFGGMGRKHCGKKRKCRLPVFSPFLTMF